MEIVGAIFLIIAVIIAAVGGIMMLIAAFRTSVIWGIGMLIPSINGIVYLIFLFTNWDEAKRPFLIQLAAIPFALLAGVCMGMAGGSAG